MKRYRNTFGELIFSIDGEDYVSQYGDEMDLPTCEYVEGLVAKGYLVEIKVTNKK